MKSKFRREKYTRVQQNIDTTNMKNILYIYNIYYTKIN